MNKNYKGLLVGFTKWQTTKAYPMFRDFFKEYNIKLDFQKIDEYALCVANNKTNLDLNQYDFYYQQLARFHYILLPLDQLGYHISLQLLISYLRPNFLEYLLYLN